MFQNPYLEGINLLFPFLDRRQAIFIDFVILGTDVKRRREAVIAYLTEKGHIVETVRNETETLLKIDNMYYRIWPKTLVINRVPVQGANLQISCTDREKRKKKCQDRGAWKRFLLPSMCPLANWQS